MITRYFSSLSGAASITLGLFLFMHFLIATGRPAMVDAGPEIYLPKVSFAKDPPVYVDPDPTIIPPPVATTPPDRITSGRPEIGIRFKPPASGPIVAGDIELNPLVDGPPIEILTVAPNYPIRAHERNLEGWVLVEFTVTETGAVADVAVLNSSNTLFHKSAVAAAQRFKYKPNVVEGRATSLSGLQRKFTFTLED